MEYHDLDIVLVPFGPDGYVRMARCGGRHGRGEDPAPLDVASVARAAGVLDALGEERVEPEAQRALGLSLYQGLVGDGAVARQLGRCIAGRAQDSAGVRVRLDLERAPALAAIPWEFLYVPQDGHFLAASPRTPVVRYLHSQAPNLGLEVRLPVRVLVVLPQNAAAGETPLDLASEKAVLQRALQPLVRADAADVRFLERGATRVRLRAALRGGLAELGEEPFQILCYAGHGRHEEGRACLFLDGDGGAPDPVDAEWLAELFDGNDDVKLVVLNACQGATVSALRPFSGLAPRLVKAGVPAVVAMQFPVRDAEALAFAETFYGSLFRGPSRGRVEVALTEARRALRQDFPGSRAWGAPVLYARTGGYLFTPTTGSAVADIPVSREQAETQREAAREHARNIRALRAEPDSARSRAGLARELRELANVRTRLRLRVAAAAVVLAVAAAVTTLAAVLPFEALPPALRIEAYAAWLEWITPGDPLDGRIVRVPITARTAAARGRGFDATTIAAWRTDHAHVLDALSRGGARVVAFAMVFPGPSAGDTALARAIRDARSRGTSVVVGFRDWQGALPGISPALLRAGPEWGALCAGSDGTGAARILPLVSYGSAGRARPPVPAFATIVVSEFHGDRLLGVDAERSRAVFGGGPLTRTMRFWRRETGQETAGCPALSGRDTVASAVITFSPRRVFGLPKHLIGYEDLLAPGASRVAARARGKIAIVGREVQADEHQIFRLGHEVRTGEQIDADAVNSLLRGLTLRPLEGWGQLLATIAAGVLGAAAALVPRHARARRVAALLPVAVALCVGAALLAVPVFGLLLNVGSQVAALLLTAWLVHLVRCRTGF